MRIKVRIKIGAECENKQGKNNPDKPPLSQGQEEEGQRHVERSEKEKSVKAQTGREPPQILSERIRSLPMNQALHLVVHLLFDSQLPVRDWIWLEGERCGHAILIAAEHVGKRRPTTGDLLILKQCDADGRNQRQNHRG